MNHRWLIVAAALTLAGCGKSVKGTYNLINGPAGVVATFGDKTFSLSSGASGNYEISGNTVILSGDSLTGAFKIEGDKLVGDRFTFVPRGADDKTPINEGPRGGGAFQKSAPGTYRYRSPQEAEPAAPSPHATTSEPARHYQQ